MMHLMPILIKKKSFTDSEWKAFADEDCNLNNANFLQYIIENHVAYKYINEHCKKESLLAFYRD